MGINISDPVSAALSLGSSIIDRIWPDPATAADAKLKLIALQQSGDIQTLTDQAGIVQAEAESKNWLTASWRPIMMLSFVAIIVNNYLLYPYLSLFWHAAPVLQLPPDMWDLLKIGVGGYVVGRSGEKMLSTYTASKS